MLQDKINFYFEKVDVVCIIGGVTSQGYPSYPYVMSVSWSPITFRHNFLTEGEKMHFHAPIGAHLYLSIKAAKEGQPRS